MKTVAWAVMGAAMVALLSSSSWARERHDSAVLVMDVSGTIKNTGAVAEAQRLVEGMNERFPDYVKSAGMLTFDSSTSSGRCISSLDSPLLSQKARAWARPLGSPRSAPGAKLLTGTEGS